MTDKSAVTRHGITTEYWPGNRHPGGGPDCIRIATEEQSLVLTELQAAEVLAQLAWHLHRTEIR